MSNLPSQKSANDQAEKAYAQFSDAALISRELTAHPSWDSSLDQSFFDLLLKFTEAMQIGFYDSNHPGFIQFIRARDCQSLLTRISGLSNSLPLTAKGTPLAFCELTDRLDSICNDLATELQVGRSIMRDSIKEEKVQEFLQDCKSAFRHLSIENATIRGNESRLRNLITIHGESVIEFHDAGYTWCRVGSPIDRTEIVSVQYGKAKVLAILQDWIATLAPGEQIERVIVRESIPEKAEPQIPDHLKSYLPNQTSGNSKAFEPKKQSPPKPDGPHLGQFRFEGQLYDCPTGAPYRFLESAWKNDLTVDLKSEQVGDILDDRVLTILDEGKIKHIQRKCNAFFRDESLPFSVSKMYLKIVRTP